MRTSPPETMPQDRSLPGLEQWRNDDLARWLKTGLAQDEAAGPSARVWRAIDRELSTPAPRAGWQGLRHAYASLGSAVALAYALSFSALFLTQRSAPPLGACDPGCAWDRLSESEVARQGSLGYPGADAHPGWNFQLPRPRVDRSFWRAERSERQLQAEWGQAAPAPRPAVDPLLAGGIDMD